MVNGKMLKPDRMKTDADDEPADEPNAGALGADRVLRERKHPMEKFLEDAESRLNTPQPKEKKRKAADTETSAKKQLASVKKELASVEKELASIKEENA